MDSSDINCANCEHKMTSIFICENNCGTILCDNCGYDFYFFENDYIIGHNPKCEDYIE